MADLIEPANGGEYFRQRSAFQVPGIQAMKNDINNLKENKKIIICFGT